MSGVLPGFADLGNILRQGKFPRTTESLYAGAYHIWQDPGAITLLFPLHVLALFVATTPLRFCVLDGLALFHLLVGALAMQSCVRAYSEQFGRRIPHGVAAFIGVSYVTTVYSLAIGASWYSFLANQAAVPLIARAFVTRRYKTAISLVCSGMLYNLLAGHPSPFFYSVLFLGVFCLCVGALRKSWQPIIIFAAGSAIALAVVLPILVFQLSSFSSSTRNNAFANDFAVQYNLPAPALLVGALAGIDSVGSWDFHPKLGYLAEIALPLSFSAVALCLIAVLCYFRRFRRLDWTIIFMLAVVALFVQRPMWLQTIISHFPFYRSLRWPMRETFVFLFFAHLLVATGWYRISPRVARFLPAVSAAVFFLPLFLSASPTFNRFPVDRLLLLDGRAERVWREVRELMPEAQNCLVVPMAQHNVLGWAGPIFIGQAPHTLLGGYDYPVLFGMKSATGYTMPGYEQRFRDELPMYGPGYFMPGQFTEADLADPHLLFTRIESLDPVRIEYRIGQSIVHASFPHGLSHEPIVTRIH